MFEFEKLYVNSNGKAHEMLFSYVRKGSTLAKDPMIPYFSEELVELPYYQSPYINILVNMDTLYTTENELIKILLRSYE